MFVKLYILLQIRDLDKILSCLDLNFVKIGSKLTKLQHFIDRRFINRRFIDRRFIDRRFIDRHFIDKEHKQKLKNSLNLSILIRF